MRHQTCPNCGANLSRRATVCPECGSDEKTGWSSDAQYGGLDLPDQDFDYDSFVKREFGEEKTPLVPRGIHWIWWLTAILLLVAILLAWVWR